MAKFRSKFTFEPGGIFSRMALPKAFQKRQSETRFKQEWSVPLGKYGMAKYQRGSISMMAGGGIMTTGAASGMVVMTGFASNHTDIGSVCWGGVRFNNDGSQSDRGPGAVTYTQADPGEWWSAEPEADIGSSYDVRALSGGSGTWSVSAAADNTWIQMDVDRLWAVSVIAKNSPDVNSASRTFEVRDTGSGSALDSGFYSASCEN